MAKFISLMLKFVLICAGGYVLLAAGEFAASGAQPAPQVLQAFGALVGLGLMLRLFSATPARARLRW